MAVVSKHHQFIYLLIPKTGSTSMQKMLRRRFGGRPQSPHHAAEIPNPDHYLVWTMVRNPWTRLLSWYASAMRDYEHLRGSMTLAEFIRDLSQQQRLPEPRTWDERLPQHEFIQKQPCDTFIHLERVSSEFPRLEFAKGKDANLQVLNTSDWSGNVSDHYDDRAVEAAIRYGVVQSCEVLGYPIDVMEAT